MKRLLCALVLLFSVLPVWSQTGKAETSGLCSPANTGNNNTFTINCGIGKTQGDMLLRIVNKILSNQTDLRDFGEKLDAILEGVNDIKHSAGPRHMTEEQKRVLVWTMSRFMGERVSVESTTGDVEAYRYAQDFVQVFKSAGLQLVARTDGADKTGVNLILEMGGAPRSGLVIEPSDEKAWRGPLVQSFASALSSAKIRYTAQYTAGRAFADFAVFVGPKPIE